MNKKQYALHAIILFLGIVTNISKAALPSEALSGISMVTASESVLPSWWTIECKNDTQWIITSSNHSEPMVFSLDEMTHIVSSMHGDGQAAVLVNNDYRPLMQHMIENDIKPQSILAASSNPAESSGAAASAAAPSHCAHNYDSVRSRMQDLRGLMRSGVTVRSVKSQQKWVSKSGVARLSFHWAPDFIKHQDAQINGKISQLEAALRSTKPGTREYRAIESMLKAQITQELHTILKSPSSDGEVIVAQIQGRWPYCKQEISQSELPAVQKHLEKVGFNELQAARCALTMRKKAERYQAALLSGDSAKIKDVQAELKANIAQEKSGVKRGELQRLYDRLQLVIDHPNFDQLATLQKAATLEEAYLIRDAMGGVPMSADMTSAMQHIWVQKEGATDFARLPESERESRIAAYKAARESGASGATPQEPSSLVLENVTLGSPIAEQLAQQVNVPIGKLEDVTDMTTDAPTMWYGSEISAEKTALFAAYHQEIHEALIREGLIVHDMPRAVQVAELFIETLAHELHPDQIQRDIDGLKQLAKDVAQSATTPINGVEGRSHLGHPHPRVIAALEAGVGGAQEVARRLVTPMEGVDKSPLVQVLRAAGDLTPEQITIISAKVTADWIKFEALSTVGAYVSRADVLGKIRDAAQRVERGTLTAEQAKQMLISDGIVFEARVTESGAASAAESTVQKRSTQMVKGGGKASEAIVPEIGEKLKYVFGKATGSLHNVERSTTMARQLGRIGIFDNTVGRSCLENHLKAVLNDKNSILKVQGNGRILRESLLMGPNGGIKMHSVWQESKLITINLFGT